MSIYRIELASVVAFLLSVAVAGLFVAAIYYPMSFHAKNQEACKELAIKHNSVAEYHSYSAICFVRSVDGGKGEAFPL